MIEITYSKEGSKFSVTCTGHAGFAEKGQDIVCASATMLAYTLAENLLEMPGAVDDVKHIFTDGKIEVSAVAKDSMASVIELVFDVIVTGMRMLADQYPEHVELSLVPGIEKEQP